MKLAITVKTPQKDTTLDQRFGRAPYFAIVDTDDTDTIQFVENPALSEAHGAGVLAAQVLIDQGVNAVVCAKFGPNGDQALRQAGISQYLFQAENSIQAVIDSFLSGGLQALPK